MVVVVMFVVVTGVFQSSQVHALHNKHGQRHATDRC